jgi:CelD/BcsL family acetyltransferase involved in cellulose biosynthesis/ribosomal protein S18 acetylase RimI-like enzyme
MRISIEAQDPREFKPAAGTAVEGCDRQRYKTQQITELPQIEESRRTGPLAAWEQLLASDPVGTLFQGPVWCLEWYRAYHERYQPCVLAVTYGAALVGLVPLAVERATGELVFASGIMSDYRDVIALPQHKQTVIASLLRFYCAGGFSQPLRLGPMLPESDTAAHVLAAGRDVPGAYAIPRSHPGWRWWPSDGAPSDFVKKKSIRQAIKHYERQGAVRVARIDTVEDWHEFKHEFFDQHSIRQIYAGRRPSFNSGMKQSFYDALMLNSPGAVHVVALRVADRIIAAHYGPVHDRVLYWGAPAFDIREAQRSPGLVLLALIIQNAEQLGLRGIDLTIGVEEYKRRFSSSSVTLPTVEIYCGRRRYYGQVLRDRAVDGAKLLVGKAKGPAAWEQAKGHLDRVGERAQKLREFGIKESCIRMGRRAVTAVGERARWLTLSVTPAALQPVEPALSAGESCSFHTDELRDMLKWDGPSAETARAIAALVRRAPVDMRNGRTLHTLLVAGRLACWGWSYWPQGPELIDVTQTELAYAPNSVSLYDFHTIPEFRGRRLYQALLTHILRTRFAEGAELAYIMVRDTNVASRKAIERVGFRVVAVDEISRLLGRSRIRHAPMGAVGGPSA